MKLVEVLEISASVVAILAFGEWVLATVERARREREAMLPSSHPFWDAFEARRKEASVALAQAVDAKRRWDDAPEGEAKEQAFAEAMTAKEHWSQAVLRERQARDAWLARPGGEKAMRNEVETLDVSAKDRRRGAGAP